MAKTLPNFFSDASTLALFLMNVHTEINTVIRTARIPPIRTGETVSSSNYTLNVK